MILSLTGFLYLAMAVGLGIIACGCLKKFEREKRGEMGKLFGYFFSFFALATFTFGIVSIFGAFFNAAGKEISFFINLLFAFGCASLGYLIIYFKSREINPWLGFVALFIIGIAATLLNFPYEEFTILETGEINFGPFRLGQFLSFLLFLLTFLPMSIILFQQVKFFKGPFLKSKSFMFGLLALGGFIIAFIETIIEPVLNLEKTYINETALIGVNTILYSFLIATERDFETK